ncbi:hypothetical protein [Nitratireductor luteus]|uniref:hypothetical protein n=1 Tax=Nitratireductor luteus TaxID=2976980 RepID=UPI0022403FEC|nr:hypothetical protein [Nitratireductor luteus]
MSANRIPLANIREAQAKAIMQLLRDHEYRRGAFEHFEDEWQRLAAEESAQLERAMDEGRV